MNKPALWTKDFIGISFTNFLLFMTFYFLLVTLPVYVLNELNGTETEAGLATTVFLISAILIRFISGQWVEHFGKKNVLIASLVLFLAALIIYPFVSGLNALLILRFFHGIGFGMATTAAGAIVADIIPNSRRGEGMGYYVMSMNVAMAIGPFAGLFIMNKWGIGMGFTVCMTVAFISLLISFSLKKDEAASEKPAGKFKLDLSPGNLIEKSALPIALTGTFFAIVYSAILSFVSVYAQELHIGEAAGFFFVVYAVVIVLSRPFTGRWFDLYGANAIVYPSIVLFAAGMLLLSQAGGTGLFLIAAGVIGLGWGTLFPGFQTIAISKARPEKKALATATFLSLFDLGIGFGSFVVGIVAAGLGFKMLYAACAVYVLAGLIVYYFVQKNKTEPKHSPQ
ncbi:MFS transporter [Domibacillus iocasae]|uniref:Multidrug MFS transporter n=1 Tax=Domibacillus iocasae TaxID=1714016 RepID=A0A1E7DQB9_9BACI|nr:MFS transporter [Domibacillus iocasae]OES45290.1 multidrug MFS transporter [Domibacillus iocasae]